ncbi:MAG TPA: methionyl-tRNA formyltransferase, partial [Cytophagaceae bacterium]|jgi:methionyl-tRNA formyltransferase
MLPEQVWNMPRLGTFNLHASLLPQYRGAAPINWAIINGEKETGVTTFFLQHEIDTGNIIFQEKEIILDEDNFESLYGKLMNRGAGLVLKTIDAIQSNIVKSIAQEHFPELKSAPKIHKETCKIDWSWTSEKIKNFVRGLCPYPSAWTILEGKVCKIFKVSISLDEDSITVAGNVFSDQKTFLQISTGSGVVNILELQMEGKKRMSVEEFLRGNKLQVST